MLDTMANHATRVRRYQDLYGISVVEEFIDICLSIENLIDLHRPYRPKTKKKDDRPKGDLPDELIGDAHALPRIEAKEYMDEYVNPTDFMAQQRQKQKTEDRT